MLEYKVFVSEELFAVGSMKDLLGESREPT